MTTQEPVEDPGLDALWDAHDRALLAYINGPDLGATAPVEAAKRTIEAQAIAPWRTAVARAMQNFRPCELEDAEDFRDRYCKEHGDRWPCPWGDLRALLHPNAEGGSNG